jgi:3',5'-nucleoside bisphosphate phosphatase
VGWFREGRGPRNENEKDMANIVDLHTHSTASDGLYSPTELFQRAADAGLRVVALTDHDSTSGLAEAAQAAQKHDIEFIPGIELNTDIHGGEVHVLGYFPEYTRPEFQSVLQILRNARVHRGQRMVELLNEQGVHIQWQRVREIAQGSVGRPHVAKALLEAGYVKTIPEAFEKYIGSHSPAYVPRYKLTPQDAIRLIASANGVPVMAHPITLPGLAEMRMWLPELRDAGLVGMEVYYGPYAPEEVQELKAFADKYHLIATGGSDYHGPGIHPTPLGGRYVPYEAVEQLRAVAAERHGKTAPAFELPPPDKEK